jgi:phage terminase large subunit-like protein
MTGSKKFQEWIRIEAARATGEFTRVENYIDKELVRNVKIEVKHNGRWIEEKQFDRREYDRR